MVLGTSAILLRAFTASAALMKRVPEDLSSAWEHKTMSYLTKVPPIDAPRVTGTRFPQRAEVNLGGDILLQGAIGKRPAFGGASLPSW